MTSLEMSFMTFFLLYIPCVLILHLNRASLYGINISWSFHFSDVPVAVQVESLHCFMQLCYLPKVSSESEVSLAFQLQEDFPLVLVPLASYNQVSIWFLSMLFSCLFFKLRVVKRITHV